MVSISLICLIAAIVVELFFMDLLSVYVSVQSLEYFTLIATFILMTDIYFSFLKSTNRKEFLKKNALKILILLPWGTIFRALSFLKMEQFFAEIPILSDLFAMEKVSAAAGKTVIIAEKTKRIAEL